MNNVVSHAEFLEVLHRRLEACEPCGICGEPGTWANGLCPLCADGGGDDIEARQERRFKRLREDRPGTLLACGVPSRFARVKFEEPKQWPVDARYPELPIHEWSGSPSSLLMTGLTGTGKTMFGVDLCFRWVCSGTSARFLRASQVPSAYFTDDGEDARELETVDLLALDDLGRGHLGRAWEALGELLAARYDDELPTIVTTNLGLDQIAEFDAHAADRLFDGLVVTVNGDSRRGLKGAS